jgi:hypothetical protein
MYDEWQSPGTSYFLFTCIYQLKVVELYLIVSLKYQNIPPKKGHFLDVFPAKLQFDFGGKWENRDFPLIFQQVSRIPFKKCAKLTRKIRNHTNI